MKKIFAANWKMHKTPRETRQFFELWKLKFRDRTNDGRKFIFFPQAACLESAAFELKGTEFGYGAQNVYFEEKGAFTGETSPALLSELEAEWALVGHSERRQLFGETDGMISRKVKKLHDLGLKPLVCIGESLQQREAGQTLEVLKNQMRTGLAGANQKKSLIIAYEPVWAIGTGKVADLDQVQEAHIFIAQELKTMGFNEETPILYGGSVKPDNAKALIEVPFVGGFLVGGASLEVESFLAIAG